MSSIDWNQATPEQKRVGYIFARESELNVEKMEMSSDNGLYGNDSSLRESINNMASQVQPKFEFTRLASKPTSRISYSFSPAISASKMTPRLVVFVNGLGLPQAGWTTAILKLRQMAGLDVPAILTYDRYGQGRTVDRDPVDGLAIDPCHGHDCVDAAHDMRELISQVASEMMGISNVNNLQLVLVANELGCAIARLYAQEYPGTVSGIIFLASTLTNTDFVSLFPDPDSHYFGGSLPANATLDEVRETRTKLQAVLHPSIPNKEGLSRRSLMQLLPYANSPKLIGPGGRGPLITVIGQDFNTFAQQMRKTMGLNDQLFQACAGPYWQHYNEGLTYLTEPGRSIGPLEAPGTGQFVQSDNPTFFEHTGASSINNNSSNLCGHGYSTLYSVYLNYSYSNHSNDLYNNHFNNFYGDDSVNLHNNLVLLNYRTADNVYMHIGFYVHTSKWFVMSP
ncbi:hypothetical protein HJFPF1_12563 [Paramyrothecium foliicola]|nr:hypothetical protein HJFPF1_12563 [Paramyrothecium foliicola]